MRWLGDDDGAVAVIVTLLLLVFFGFAAFAVDAGALYAERRELQSGADAGALALAEDCGNELLDCVSGQITGAHYAVAEPYADANASDGAATVSSIAIDHAEQRVDVTTLVEDAGSGANLLTHWFAAVIGISASEVRASAAATWGEVPTTLTVFPIAFCIGEFNAKTAYGTSFGPPEYHVFYSNPPGGEEIDCELDPDAGDNDSYPGGFAWLETDATCQTHIADVPGWYPGRPGQPMPSAGWAQYCLDMITAKINEMDADPDAPPLLVPIFDNYAGQGQGGSLHLIGFGAFRPTGYRFSGANSYPPAPEQPCQTPQNRCIRGWFTDWVTVSGSGSGGQGFGVTTVQLVE